MSIGGSKSKSRTSSESSSDRFGLEGSQSSTYLDAGQQANQQQLVNNFFGQNFNNGLQRMQNIGNNVNAGINQQVNSLAPWLQNASQSANFGSQALQAFATQNNPFLNSQIGGLAQDAGRYLNEQVLPGIMDRFGAGGQRGSSQNRIAAGEAAGRVGEDYLQQATNLRSNAYGQQLQAAQALAQTGTQGFLGGQQQLGQSLYNQGNLAQQYANQFSVNQLRPFEIGAGVVGAPSILSDSSSFGIDSATARSKSKGKSSSGSFNLGFTTGD